MIKINNCSVEHGKLTLNLNDIPCEEWITLFDKAFKDRILAGKGKHDFDYGKLIISIQVDRDLKKAFTSIKFIIDVINEVIGNTNKAFCEEQEFYKELTESINKILG